MAIKTVEKRIIDLLNLHDDLKFIITEKYVFIERFLESLENAKDLESFFTRLFFEIGVLLGEGHDIRKMKLAPRSKCVRYLQITS